MYSIETQDIIAALEAEYCGTDDVPGDYGYSPDYFVPIYFDSIRDAVAFLVEGDIPNWENSMDNIANIINNPDISCNNRRIGSIYEVIAEGLRRYKFVFKKREVSGMALCRLLNPGKKHPSTTFLKYFDSGTKRGGIAGERMRNTLGLDSESLIADIEQMLDTARKLMEKTDDPRAMADGIKAMSYVYKMMGVQKTTLENLVEQALKRIAKIASSSEVKKIEDGDANEPEGEPQDGRTNIINLPGITDAAFRKHAEKVVVGIKSRGLVKKIEDKEKCVTVEEQR